MTDFGRDRFKTAARRATVWRMFIGILWMRMLLLMVGFLLVAGVGIDDLAIDLDAPYGNVKLERPPFLALRELFEVSDLTHTAFIKQKSNDLQISPFSVLEQRISLGLWLRLLRGGKEAAGLIIPCPTSHFPSALKSYHGLEGLLFLR